MMMIVIGKFPRCDISDTTYGLPDKVRFRSPPELLFATPFLGAETAKKPSYNGKCRATKFCGPTIGHLQKHDGAHLETGRINHEFEEFQDWESGKVLINSRNVMCTCCKPRESQ